MRVSRRIGRVLFFSFFFFNDTATTEIYTLSLHDALPISSSPTRARGTCASPLSSITCRTTMSQRSRDRKSTRLNSSHPSISYAVFCLKKKKLGLHVRQELPHGVRALSALGDPRLYLLPVE